MVHVFARGRDFFYNRSGTIDGMGFGIWPQGPIKLPMARLLRDHNIL